MKVTFTKRNCKAKPGASLRTGLAKIRGHRLMTIILSILNRFKKMSVEDSLVNLQLNGYLKNPIASCICCYTTL